MVEPPEHAPERRTGAGDRRSAPAAPRADGPERRADGSGRRAPAAQEAMPSVVLTRKRIVLSILFVASIVAFLYLVLPKILGLGKTWNRIEHGDAWWLACGVGFELLSFFGYIALFRATFIGADEDAEAEADAEAQARIGWEASYEITMSGLAATRLFASAGAGGIALTAWALRRAGFEPRTVATRMVAFMVLLYGVFMGTLVLGGVGLYVGLFPGSAPFAITVVPAIFGAIVIGLFLSFALAPVDFEALVARHTNPEHRIGRLGRRLAAAPASAAEGVRTAIALVRTRDPFLLGAIGWWAFDIAVLWACFHAFGSSPAIVVVVMAYFVGMFGNTLPLPGGIGGVDGGMIGAFSAFDVNVSQAVVAVLAYRAIAFWLPTLPGAIAYLQLRRTVHRWEESDVGSPPTPPPLTPSLQ